MTSVTYQVTVAELAIGGVTCASCAARIERKLNGLGGVSAAVNFATETARVTFPATLTTEDLVSAVEQAGYTAMLADARRDEPGTGGTAGRSRLLVSITLAVPVVLLGMIPAWQFRDWQWVSLALASPVAVWGAWPFHRAALAGSRHGAATMDTLISVGVTAAYLWSLYALVSGGEGETYLEVAAGVTALVLLGRRLEARARRRSGAALRALLSLGAKDVAVRRDGTEARIPAAELAVGDEFSVRPGETIAADGVVIAGRSAVDTSMLTGEPAPAEGGPGGPVTGGGGDAGGAPGGRAGRPRDRRVRERRRPPGDPGRPGRRGHPAGQAGPAGRAGPGGQGAG